MADDKKLVEKKPVAKKKVAVTNKLSKEEQLEQLYQKTIAVFESMSCMTVTKSKLDMYNHLKNEFGSLKDYKDSEEYVKQCTERYEENEKMLLQKEYEYCCRHLESAKTEKDYNELRQAFLEFKDYKDSEKLVQQCDKVLKSKANKLRYAIIRKAGIVLALLVIILFACTKTGRYNVARVFNKLTFYQRSATMYENLGSYKDSKSRYKEATYNNAVRLEKAGSNSKAQELYYDINTYQDSAKRLVAVEKKMLEEANIGDKVRVGAYTWIVLDKQEDKVLCIKYKPLSKIAYSNEDTNVTWETSQIRAYLNAEFISAKFCEEETSNMVVADVVTADNQTYNTSGGNATKDKIYLLDLEEIAKYEAVLGNIVEKTSWLRSSGGLQSAVSVFDGKNVNHYGRLATEHVIYAYPIFWYSIK